MKRLSPHLSLCVLAVIIALGASCARKPDDAKISSDIQSKFSQDSGLSGKQITVQASNGTVTLEGAVDNDAQRDAASRQAASIAGVKQVVNNLQVGAMAATPASPAMQASYPPENPKPAPSRREFSRKSRRSAAARDAVNNDHAYTVEPIRNDSTEVASNA